MDQLSIQCVWRKYAIGRWEGVISRSLHSKHHITWKALPVGNRKVPECVTARKLGEGSFSSGRCFYGGAEDVLLSESVQGHSESNLWLLCASGRVGEVMDVLGKGGALASKKLCAQVMRRCGQMKALPVAKRVHAHLAERKLESDNYLGSEIVEMYVKCGSLVDAERVHRRLPHRSEFSWTALISGYANHGQGRDALRIYKEMRDEGVTPSTCTFVQALKACSSLGDWKTGKKIHADMIESGNDSGMFAANTLIDMYAKCGSLVDAQLVFDKLPHRDVVSWTSMILGYAQKEDGETALQLYAWMQQEGIAPDARTFVGALKACCSLAALEKGTEVDGKFVKSQCLKKGRSIHSQLAKGGFESNVFVGTTLVDMYAKCGSMVDARHAFDKLPFHDVVSWTAMILGYAEKEEGDVALQLYAQMQQEGVMPNERTFVGALKACSSLATLEVETEVVRKLEKRQCLKKGRAIHAKLVKRGFESNAFVGTVLIDMYVKCGSMIDAQDVFDRVPCPDIVSWNGLILGYVERSETLEAFHLYAQMQEQGLSADTVTFVNILKACGNIAALETGREIHAEIGRCGVSDINVATALVDMYGKCGCMVDAQRVFDAWPARDVVIWSALIAGYMRQGESELVFHLFERMRQDGMQPNGVTFLSVLTTCSHAGLVDKGWEYFNAMSTKYGLIPTIEHYNCIADLLGRAGQMDRAVKMVERMPFQPNIVTWLTVLGACRKWTNLEVGRHAFECAVRLDEQHSAAYILMSNIYGDARMWEERDNIQKMRESAQAWKKPGQSWWTEIGGMVHTFGVKDATHPQSKCIYAKLKDLSLRMEKGYLPDPECVR